MRRLDLMLTRRPRRTSARRAQLFIGVLFLWFGVPPAAEAQSIEDLKRLTLEEMLNLEVTTVSRTPEPAGLTPAALFVITRDDIRRSGATSLAELLRMAPGMHVAQIDAFRWAIGMRGLADRLSRSMLVLIDGRPAYNPLFAGTYWEVQDVVLADIDRIEIIRGPGGTLWGANAVNGIISIVTRHASETQGLYLHAITGTEERGLGTIRYGMSAGSNGFVRGYFKGTSRDAQLHPSDLDYDDWWKAQGGMRGDWALENGHALMLKGDLYAGRLGQQQLVVGYDPPYTESSLVDVPVSGSSVAARWSGPARRAQFDLGVYYDRTHRDELPVGEVRNTLEIDFNQRHELWQAHQLAWGAGYRVTADDITAVGTSRFTPARYTDHVISAFAEDALSIGRRLRVSVGTKIERNTYSGVELQPSMRTTWEASATHTLVGSITRAVRTPSRVETHYETTSVMNPAIPAFVRLVPNPDFRPEKLVAYELGYRLRPRSDVYVTVSAFYNTLDDVLSTELLTPFSEETPSSSRLIVPVSFRNGLTGSSRGVESTADVRPAPWWRTILNYSFMDVELARLPGSMDVSQERANEGRTPHHQVQLRTAFDLPRQMSFDWFLRFVSELADGDVPAYATSDLRIGWQPVPAMEIALVGKNLHAREHREWPGEIGIQRSAFVSLTVRR